MTQFRPCIDLHNGTVKQIVGGSLDDHAADKLQTNFTAQEDAAWYAARYRTDGVTGGHVIKLGPGNDDAALRALAAWPGGLQIGGGITAENAAFWLHAGASHVIVTSWLFPNDELDWQRLRDLSAAIGPERLVIDLSCRRVQHTWRVATKRWQHITPVVLNAELFEQLAPYCAEFLIHAADVEGLCQGIDTDLVTALGTWACRPCTYAGGGKSLLDLDTVAQLSQGRCDLTLGSALDMFGGSGAAYSDCIAWNKTHQA